MLTLQDMKGKTEAEIKQHLISEYGATESQLKDISVLIAYESVGDWGCDSSSFFLLKDKKSKKLYEIHGSHCSCFGFENQYTPEETTVQALKDRAAKKYVFSTGGYDYDSDRNVIEVLAYIDKKLK